MNKSLIMFGASACVLLAFPACQSSKNSGGYGDYEEATMASDTIADGEIPPWLLEDDGSAQVSAGERTISRNDYAIPEPNEALAETGSRINSSRQNQPNLAENDVNVEKPSTEVPEWETPAPDQAIAAVAAPSARTEAKAPTVKPKKPSAKPGKKPAQRARSKRYEEPTMLTYKVRPGDNLSDIAKRSRTTVAQIKKSSGLKGDTIYPGQTIKVRYSPKNYKPGNIGSKRTTQKAAAKNRNHVVAKGETISGIAKKYGLPYGTILKANNMSATEATKIRPGKRIVIPGKTSSSKTNSKRRKR